MIASTHPSDATQLARPLRSEGHEVSTARDYGRLRQLLVVEAVDVVLLEQGFDGIDDEVLLRAMPRQEGATLKVVVLMPDLWPHNAGRYFAWGADDLVRRPLLAGEVIARVCRNARCRPDQQPPCTDWSRLRFWRDLESDLCGELGAYTGESLSRADARAESPVALLGVVQLSLPAEGTELAVGVGAVASKLDRLAATVLGGTAALEVLSDAVGELANITAGAVKRRALDAGKVFSLGLPRVLQRVTPPAAVRRWRGVSQSGLDLEFVACTRSSHPTVIASGKLREGMVVNQDILGPTGLLLAAQGTQLTERSIERLRQMIGDSHVVEVTMPQHFL